MQLILAGVFHLDVPPGNVPLAAVRALAQHPQVAQLIPLSLGDSAQGFRIVGTTHDYPSHSGARLAEDAVMLAYKPTHMQSLRLQFTRQACTPKVVGHKMLETALGHSNPAHRHAR